MTGIDICPQCSASNWRIFASNSNLTTTKKCIPCGFESSKTVDYKSALKNEAALTGKVVIFGLLFSLFCGVIFFGVLLAL